MPPATQERLKFTQSVRVSLVALVMIGEMFAIAQSATTTTTTRTGNLRAAAATRETGNQLQSYSLVPRHTFDNYKSSVAKSAVDGDIVVGDGRRLNDSYEIGRTRRSSSVDRPTDPPTWGEILLMGVSNWDDDRDDKDPGRTERSGD
mmetsp:Transcript_3170/g.6547  ORF Transcript_3170/g.6547 Transcript_3170/m.6547 type:complete len:147 (+) Transcript_3170:198-638(+)|eukprot:CAMPEP_0194323026 /NCGR_PEP_ID=MMETSP0171-20130528/23576_1 /TAXON_ID=218684 /ORGANISM="Corethron pennatum, Strain L29A3" /LENGTH=146 /DNA_ID=CAMNT_0039081505 /DNA_START=195 /DNA_END=635 /DNA_ORIENTATION=+